MGSFLKTNKYWLAVVCLLAIVMVSGFNTGEKKLRVSVTGSEDTARWPASFGIGRAATAAEITAIDNSVKPDGRGLPPGSGNVSSGKSIYEVKCIACHGAEGKGGPFSVLVGVMGDTTKAKTIGNYWPYATTLFDYVRRAMPFNNPGSLSNNEVYSLTAYLLYKNNITPQGTVLTAVNLPKIVMPAHSLFINDDRHGGAEIK